MKASNAARELIKKWEGLHLTPYVCPLFGSGPTVGIRCIVV